MDYRNKSGNDGEERKFGDTSSFRMGRYERNFVAFQPSIIFSKRMIRALGFMPHIIQVLSDIRGMQPAGFAHRRFALFNPAD